MGGSAQRRLANLNFFLPRDVAPVLRGDPGAEGADSALVHAQHAVALRRAGAVLTDVGAVAVIVALTRAATGGRASTSDRVIGGAGLTALLVSVPIQFAADGALSRAVWWHNVRYVRCTAAAALAAELDECKFALRAEAGTVSSPRSRLCLVCHARLPSSPP